MSEHIKMPDIVPIVRYNADGSMKSYTYAFPIFNDKDLSIYLDGARQVSGFSVEGAGRTGGGSVIFDTAPPSGTIITIARELSIERVSDYMEGGSFSAASINAELDYIVASLQQVNRANELMLHYGDHETPGKSELPSKANRASKALGFDGNGDPIAVSLEGAMSSSRYTASGQGAITRTSDDKLADIASVKDYGASGDGLTNDTNAIIKALNANDAVYLPEGRYLINSTITLESGQSLYGAGDSSAIIANSNSFNVIEVVQDYASIRNLRIEGGDVGIKLYGASGPVVQTNVSDIIIKGANIGVQLDGYTNTNYPCYWNNFTRVLVEQPATHGFHLTKSGDGDTPNANKFYACRAYSHGSSTTGAGFYIEAGKYNNSFIDCEANMAPSAQGCFIIGANSQKTLLINPYAESSNMVPNIKLEAGSSETAIYNLLSMSDGAAIWDLSGGKYTAINAGYPNKNRLQRTSVSDMNATLQRFDTEYIDTSGTYALDTSHSIHLVSSYGGELEIILPNAGDAIGVMMAVKKTDSSSNVITISEQDGSGPDGKNFTLGAQYDYVMMQSNGAKWYVIASNRSAGNTRYYNGSGTYDIDMAVDTYLLSSYDGVMTARLPPANASHAIGRTITIKKTDPSANAITITEQGGNGPDNSTHTLGERYDALSVVSNGAQWYVLNRFS